MTNNNTEKALQELATLLEFVSQSINLIHDDNEDNSDKKSVELAKRAYAIKDTHAQYKTITTALHDIYSRLIFKDIPIAMAAEGVDSQRIIGVGSISIKPKINVSVTDEKKLHAFLIANNYDSIIKTKSSVHPQTLKAFLKNYNDADVPGVDVTKSSRFY
jgi:hypothetical protein